MSSLLEVMSILPEEAEEDCSVAECEGGQRESYDDLRTMLSELLDEKERLTQELNDKCDEIDEARLNFEDLDTVNQRLLAKLNSLPGKVKEFYNNTDSEEFSPVLANKPPLEQDYQKITKEYNNLLQELDLKDEDISDLKAERANIKLLLEHLECLVARHEKVLRVTVVRRQQQPSGVSSEVEVLKALKSLFEHHKALDEKVRERCRKVTEEKQDLEEKVAHKEEECQALKQIVITAQKDGNLNGLLSAADSNLFASKCTKCEDVGKRYHEAQDELEHRLVELEDLYAQRDECLDRITEMDEEYNLVSQDLDNSREIQKQLSHEIEQLQDAHEGLQIAYRELSDERDVLVGERDKIIASKSEEKLETAPISLEEYNDLRKKLEDYSEMETELSNTQKTMSKSRDDEEKVVRLSATVEELLQESNRQQQAFRAEKQELLTSRNSLQMELDLSRNMFNNLETDKASLLIELQGLRAAHSEMAKYDSISRTSSTKPLATQSEAQHTAEEKSGDNSRNTRPSLMIPPNNAYTTQVTPTATRRAASLGRSSSFTKRRDLERRGSSDAAKYNEPLIHNHTESEIPETYLDKNFSDIYSQGKYNPVDRSASKKKVSPSKLAAGADIGHTPMAGKPITREVRRVSKDRNVVSNDTQVECLDGELKDAFADLLSLHPPEEVTKENGVNGDVASSDSGESLSLSSVASLESSSSNMNQSRSSIPNMNQSHSSIPHSRSSSEIVDMSIDTELDGSDTLRRKRNTGGSLKGTIKRVFGKRKSEPIFRDDGCSPISKETDRRWKNKQQLYQAARQRGLPFALWNPDMILAWLEIYVGAPAWLVTTCRSSIRSGAVMSALSDTEIQREMGITSYLHRLKIRLAIQEMVNQTSPSAPVGLPSFGHLTHLWVSEVWLPSIGLPQHYQLFVENLIDGRMLSHLTKKDLRQSLKFTDPFHRTSFYFAVEMLKKLNYNLEEMERRRMECQLTKTDVMVWTNDRVGEWLQSIGFGLYCSHLATTGIHGSLIACHSQFTADEFAELLQLPKDKPDLKRVLSNEFNLLLSCGTERGLMEETPDKGAVVMRSNRTKSWRSKKNRTSMVPNAARVGMSSLSSVSGSFFDVDKTMERWNHNREEKSPTSSHDSLSKKEITSSRSSLRPANEHSLRPANEHSLRPANEHSPALGRSGYRGSTASLTSKSSIRINEQSSDDRKLAQVSLVAPRKVISVRRVPSATSLSPSVSSATSLSPSISSDDKTVPGAQSPSIGLVTTSLEQDVVSHKSHIT